MNPPAAALFEGLNALCQSAAPALLDKIGQALCTAAPDMPLNELLARLPGTNNSDAHFQLLTLLGIAQGMMTWSELGWSLQAITDVHVRQQHEQRLELVWTGPRLDNAPALRRLDQALYDLIGQARRTILLMTFAAAKIIVDPIVKTELSRI